MMATDTPLLIPIEAKALVVNAEVRLQNFQRWIWNYGPIAEFVSPEPAPFEQANLGFPGTGIQLHWTLPAALRKATQDPGSGEVKYPLVPNRWLVIRYSGPASARVATAWVVQSDHVDATSGSAPFLDPTQKAPSPTKIGRCVELGAFREPSPAPPLFLTAVAPGNVMFAAFQPFCADVFSLFDPLTGVTDTDSLSYVIAGWYSAPGEDYLAGWQRQSPPDFAEFLAHSGWSVADRDAGTTATWAVYHATIRDIPWSLNGPVPPTNRPDGSAIPIAIGNTAVDALTALIKSQASGDPTIDAEMLEALQYGLLPVYDQPDARFELALQVEHAAFGTRSGGFDWEIVDTPLAPGAEPEPPLSPAELAKEAAWLAALVQAQRDYDRALADLAAAQWDLHALWWKRGEATNNLVTFPATAPKSAFDAAFDDKNPGSAVSSLAARLDAVRARRATIPTGDTQEELARAIARYAAGHGLPDRRTLKRVARRPFFLAKDPVLLMPGLALDPGLAPSRPVLCCFPAELPAPPPLPEPVGLHDGQVPAALADLAGKLFSLDPKDVWQEQPWSPLVMLWEVQYSPIAHEQAGAAVWTFDGDDYDWSGDLAAVGAPLTYRGTIFLTAHASLNFRQQLEKYLVDHPDSPRVQALEALIDATFHWDFLSQSLVGLTQQMLLRTPRPYLSVDAEPQTFFAGRRTLSELVGAAATYAPAPGDPAAPAGGPTGFQPMKAGQLAITRLLVIDRFGQSVEVVTSQNALDIAPILAPPLAPTHPVSTQSPDRFFQLNPRLLEPGRLDMEFVSSARDGEVLGVTPEVNPICGFLLHNYLDESIAAYTQDGDALGALRVVTSAGGQESTRWDPAPGSRYPTLRSMIDARPLRHLGLFLEALTNQDPGAFRALVATLNERSWTLDAGDPAADQALAMLAGRPIALLRIRLQLALTGSGLTDPSWPYTFDPAPPAFTSYRFAVRLGEGAMRQDGLMGYFVDESYDRMFAPAVPEKLPPQGYVQPIGTGSELTLAFDGVTAAYLTVLIDPRAKLHATTGLVPVETLTLPQTFVRSAFARMEVFFRVGPVLAGARRPAPATTPDDAVAASDGETVLVPRPAGQRGAWDWLTWNGADWTTMAVAPPATTADFANAPPVLRSGLLRLSGALGKKQPT